MREKKSRIGHWSGMDAIIPETLRSIPSQRDNMLEWMSLQWSLSVGEKIAGISQVEKASKKTLHVLVDGEEWLSVLKEMERKILSNLNGRLGQDRFSRIFLKSRKVTRKNTTPGFTPIKSASRSVTPHRGPRPKADLLSIKDSELRNTLESLSKKFHFISLTLACVFLSNCSGAQMTGAKVNLSESYAVQKIHKLNQKNPDAGYRDPRSYFSYLMALKAERKRHFKEAAEHYIQAVEHDPTKEEFFEKLVLFLLRSAQLDRAVTWSMKALERFPKNVDIRAVLADVLSSQGEMQQALDHYKKITEIDPGNSRAYLLTGHTLYTMDQHAQAQESFKQALLVESANPFSL